MLLANRKMARLSAYQKKARASNMATGAYDPGILTWRTDDNSLTAGGSINSEA